MKVKNNKIDKNLVIKYAAIAFFVITAIYCSVVLINNISDISRLKAQAADADIRYEQQLEENEKVKAVLDSKNKDGYIEQKAREKGYAKDGETVFYDISSSK